MKFGFNWPSGFWENCFKYVNGTPTVVTLPERSKVDFAL